MRKWSDNGREPSETERQSIDVGLIAVREFPEKDEETFELSEKLSELSNYFEDWPSDKKAAGTEEDKSPNSR
jgi:hypothetical protein